MECPTCGYAAFVLHHDLDRARIICKSCGHLGTWMSEPEWRALVQVAIDAMRGAPAVLREMAERADANEAA
jgi:transcription initiation factor TFIIIB Brf1 subunit/transcription initiation factor TFIIB